MAIPMTDDVDPVWLVGPAPRIDPDAPRPQAPGDPSRPAGEDALDASKPAPAAASAKEPARRWRWTDQWMI